MYNINPPQILLEVGFVYSKLKKGKQNMCGTCKQNDFMKQFDNCVIEYIRDENNRRRGVLLGQPLGDDEYLVGYSLCNPKDKFDREFALWLAVQRAVLAPTRLKRVNEDGTVSYRVHKIHPDVRKNMLNFLTRCDKYFKGRKSPEWCGEAWTV